MLSFLYKFLTRKRLISHVKELNAFILINNGWIIWEKNEIWKILMLVGGKKDKCLLFYRHLFKIKYNCKILLLADF